MRKFGLKSVLLFSVLALSVFFYGCKQPTDPDEDDNRTGGGKTGDLSFLKTENDSSVTGMSITGTGTAAQTLALTVGERSVSYFAAAKEAAQTITVGGADAALVTQAKSGTVDGTPASAELAVFTVDSSAFDLMFTGGSRAFTLTVAEEGKDSVTVNVTLTVTPEKTGAAVYRVTRSGERDLPAYANGDPAKAEAWATMGSLERIRGIKDYDVASHAFLEGAANDLTDALAWVDQNAQSDEEYLIRVEQSENILPTVCLSFAEQERVTLRLRGDGGERVLKHNLGNIAAANTLRDTTNLSIGTIQSFFILRGDLRNFDPTFNPGMDKDIRHNLHLETGISFDGQGASRSASYFTHLLELGTNCRLVMLAGSRIVNFSALSASGNNVPVMYVTHGENYDYSFYMYGGEITGNSVRANHESYAPVKFPSQPGGYDHSVFFKYGGSITGNFKFGTENSADKVCFGSTVSEGVNPIYLEPDTVYELPVITE
jgi:hypothetical protein